MVRKIALAVTTLSLTMGVAGLDLVDAQPLTTDHDVEEIQVVGEIEGPPIWRITNGDRDLWILGYPEWVSSDVSWQSNFLEDVMTHSEEFLTFTGMRLVSSNPLKMMRGLRKFRQMQRIPGRERLADVLSEPRYRLYSEVKLKYAPKRDNLERMRPSFAAKELFDSAAESAGLVRGRSLIHRTMEKRAKKHKVTELSVVISLTDFRVLDVMKDTIDAAEQKCLNARLQGLDARLEALMRFSLAWADGDIAELKTYTVDEATDACHPRRLATHPEDLLQMVSQGLEAWHENVDRALNDNDSTFAIVPINYLLSDDGPLSRLRVRGYEVRVL